MVQFINNYMRVLCYFDNWSVVLEFFNIIKEDLKVFEQFYVIVSGLVVFLIVLSKVGFLVSMFIVIYFMLEFWIKVSQLFFSFYYFYLYSKVVVF